ncbi:hypothetical protein V8G54_009572 [Vigna mungo]|uniref:Uncharacterized protein n=1 Tax=Vigna mungo TaxID=3915 RepID=A0AAQ3NUS8_VIGMU
MLVSSLHFLFPALRKIDLAPAFKFAFIFPLFFLGKKAWLENIGEKEPFLQSSSIQLPTAHDGGRRRIRRHHLLDLLRASQPHYRGPPIGFHLRPRLSRALVSPFHPFCVFPPLIDTNAVKVPFFAFVLIWV